MTFPNGEEFPPVELTYMREVLVIARNVETEDYAYQLNLAYGNTFNDAVLNLGPRSMAKYTAVYENTRTGRPIVNNNDTWYRAETRIVLFTQPPFVVRPAQGTYYLTAGGDKRESPSGNKGHIIKKVPLTQTGQLAAIGTQWEQAWAKHRPVDYSEFTYT